MILPAGKHMLLTHGEFSDFGIDTLVVMNEEIDTDVIIEEYIEYLRKTLGNFDVEGHHFVPSHFLNWLLNTRKAFSVVPCLEWNTTDVLYVPGRKPVHTIEVGNI